MKNSKKIFFNFKRFLARITDYFLFYYIISSLPDFFDLYISFPIELMILIFTPLLFSPFEAMCKFLFQTTLGKALFGLKIEDNVDQKFLLRSIALDSFKKGLIINSILIPIFALFSQKSRNLLLKNQFHIVKANAFKTTITLPAILIALCFAIPYFYERYHTSSSFLSVNSKQDFSTWTSFSIPESKSKISFPGKPNEEEKLLKLPKGAKPLKYTEYSYIVDSDQVKFSVSHTKLPKSILKWSSNLVLKGCLDVVKNNENNAKIIKKEITKVNKFSGIDYQMNKGENLVNGRLILVDDLLFKVDITYKKENQEQILPLVSHFIFSFQPQM